MRVQTRVRFIALGCLGVLFACSKGGSDADEQQLLNELGFANPITMIVAVGQPASGSGAALLLATGYASIHPMTGEAPYFSFNVNAPMSNGNAVLTVGKRSIVGRSDAKDWTEGSIEYFAETVTYNIELEDKLKSATPVAFDGFSLRLVAFKDPAVGKWQVSTDPTRGTHYIQDDVNLVTNRLLSFGNSKVSDLTNQAAAAQKEAFDAIQQQLASDGLLKQDGSDPDVLISPRAHLAYYRKMNSGHGGVTIAQVEQYCEKQTAGSYKWHVPTVDELTPATTVTGYNEQNGASNGGGHLIDTPDGRLWGQLGRSSNPNTMLATDAYLTKTPFPAVGGLTVYQIGANGWGSFTYMQTTQGNNLEAPLNTDLTLHVICVADAK